jgi:hypothetical protein
MKVNVIFEHVYVFVLVGWIFLAAIWGLCGLEYASALYVISIIINTVIGYMAGRLKRWNITDIISIFIGPGTSLYMLLAGAFWQDDASDS